MRVHRYRLHCYELSYSYEPYVSAFLLLLLSVKMIVIESLSLLRVLLLLINLYLKEAFFSYPCDRAIDDYEKTCHKVDQDLQD